MSESKAITIADNKQGIIKIISNETFKKQLAAALMARIPEDYVVRSAISMINSTPKLQECTPVSIAASVLLLAQAGLAPEPWKGHGWLIPRNMKVKTPGQPDRWVTVCTALIGYRGYVTLANRSPEVTKAFALPVYEGDIFDLDLGSGELPLHKPWIRPEEGRPARGAILGAYAFVKLRNGENLVEWMTKDDIDGIRKRSKASDDGPWVTDYAEMARKTPFRRLFKWIPDGELQRIAAMDEASELGKTESVIDRETGEIITVMRDETSQLEAGTEEHKQEDPEEMPLGKMAGNALWTLARKNGYTAETYRAGLVAIAGVERSDLAKVKFGKQLEAFFSKAPAAPESPENQDAEPVEGEATGQQG